MWIHRQPTRHTKRRLLPRLPLLICQLTSMFRGLIGLADAQSPGIKPATQRHTASPTTDRSGWKFPVIQRMPSHSALLQSTFPYGTHIHTHTDDSLFDYVLVCVCVDTHAHQFGSCDLYKDRERNTDQSASYTTCILSMNHGGSCLFSLFMTHSSCIQAHHY